jgi:hypothetical protein
MELKIDTQCFPSAEARGSYQETPWRVDHGAAFHRDRPEIKDLRKVDSVRLKWMVSWLAKKRRRVRVVTRESLAVSRWGISARRYVRFTVAVPL